MKKILFVMLSVISGAAICAVIMRKFSKDAAQNQEKKIIRLKSYYDVLNQWVSFLHSGNRIEEYFINNSYKTVAVYGMGELGNRFIEELKGSSVNVKYGVDKNISEVRSDIPVYQLEEDLPEVDVVVVTAVFAFDKIAEDLSEKYDCPVVSLEDVIFSI